MSDKTASQAREELMRAEIARDVMFRSSRLQRAKRIAEHYVAHAMVAQQIVRLLDSLPCGEVDPETACMVERMVEDIKRNHLYDFGIMLDWAPRGCGDLG